jgi:deoxyribonuclease-4
MPRIGAHIHQDDPLAAAAERDANVVQFFLGDPQSWKGPVLPADTAAFRTAAEAAGVDLYVHSPYPMNVATNNNRIRIPSRKLLAQHAEAAASIGAKGLIVHGGHVLAKDDPADGFANWRKVFERGDFPLPLLIENTAGGENAMARTLDAIGRLWDAIEAGGGGGSAGFCLDTCHAHAGGEELSGIVGRIKAITGRIDLVHCNNSRDEFGSARDRHANLTAGQIDPDLLLEVAQAASSMGAALVCETPDDEGGQAADIRWLRQHLAA